MSVASSAGSPTFRADIISASASTTSSCRRSLTRMRVWATQAWPLFIRPAVFSPATVLSMSASSRMIAADLPPSSRLTLLSCSPHRAAMRRPTALEPVNAILSTPGWRTSASPISGPPGSTDTTPSGRSSCSIISANHKASRGVSGAGLIMTVHPAIRAGINLGMIKNCGTFHGTIAPTTPTGALRRCTSPSTPWRRSSHGKSRAAASARCISDAAAAAWPSRLKLRGEPISSVIRSAISSMWPA